MGTISSSVREMGFDPFPGGHMSTRRRRATSLATKGIEAAVAFSAKAPGAHFKAAAPPANICNAARRSMRAVTCDPAPSACENSQERAQSAQVQARREEPRRRQAI
jgi:hypothetical protein